MNDYMQVGIEVEWEGDLLHFAEDCEPYMNFKEAESGRYAVAEVGDIELWLYGDEEGVDPYSMEMLHKSRQEVEGSLIGWVRFPEDNDTGLLQVNMDQGYVEFPLNVEILDAFLYCGTKWEEPEEDTPCQLQMTLFARDIDVYENQEIYNKTEGKLAAEACIPCGCFPLPGKEEDFKPSATALINGIVTEAELKTNIVTGLKYWWITISCVGNKFDLVVDANRMPETVSTGNVINGYFWIAGKIL